MRQMRLSPTPNEKAFDVRGPRFYWQKLAALALNSLLESREFLFEADLAAVKLLLISLGAKTFL